MSSINLQELVCLEGFSCCLLYIFLSWPLSHHAISITGEDLFGIYLKILARKSFLRGRCLMWLSVTVASSGMESMLKNALMCPLKCIPYCLLFVFKAYDNRILA